MTDRAALEQALLSAHDRGDQAQLVQLYTQAADASDDHDQGCFFLTQAYVYALEIGHGDAGRLKARLQKAGRI